MTGILDTGDNRAVIRRVLAAVSVGDRDVLDGHPGYHETRRVVPMVRAAFPDLSITVERQVAEGELVPTHSWLDATHLGDFVGIAPTALRSARGSIPGSPRLTLAG